LAPDLQRSIDYDTARNVFIEGDNLEVLKLLQKACNDKVKLIYIDPPYNTGGDLIYLDDFADGLRGYHEFTAQVSEDGMRKSAKSESAGRFHSQWLSMMLPRLVAARNLLTEDGVLLCSINDVEFPNLMLLLNEVFGEENHLATFVWINEGHIEQQSVIKSNHEYVVAFARNLEEVRKPTVIDPNMSEQSKLFNAEIENSITKNGPKNPPSIVTLPKGFPASATEFIIAPRTDKWPHILDEIVVKEGALAVPARVESGWSSKRLLDLFISNGLVPIEDSEERMLRFDITPTGAIYGYRERGDSQGHVLTVLRNMGTTQTASSWLAREWGIYFDYPKPVKLISWLVSIFSRDDDIVVDFFAGSGTTAHAVAEQNAADHHNRRYVLVNLPEAVRADSLAASSGMTTVADITYARVKQVVMSVDGARRAGLRTFVLSNSNFDTGTDAQDILLNLREGTITAANPDWDSIAAEVFIKAGIGLDEPWARTTSGGATVVTASAVSVVTSLNLNDEVVNSVLDGGPSVVVFCEDGFAGKDAVKANAFWRCQQAGITMKTV